jgi:hypothetical protein
VIQTSKRNETRTRAGYDLNGDDVLDDQVLRYYDHATDTLIDTSAVMARQVCSVHYGTIAFFTRESDMGGDVNGNGDGDPNDFIIRYYDAATSTIVNTGVVGMFPRVYIDYYAGTLYKFILAFTAQESHVGTNLNQDNDWQDRVLGYYNVLTGDVVYTDLDARIPAGIWETVIVYEVREDALPPDRNPDLNGDGDLNDRIIRLVEIIPP